MAQAFGGLRSDNVLEYFAQSPFYDRSSNNQVLKMQSQFQTFGAFEESLRKMKGVEFIVAEEMPPDLWILRKQLRIGPSESTPLAVYFIVNGNIYMSPDAHSLLGSRVLNTTYALKTALESLHEAVKFDQFSGYSYQ